MYFNDIFSGFPDRNSSCIVINTRRFIFLYNDWRSKTWFRIVDMVLYSVRTNVKHSPNNLLATPKNGASQLSWKVCVFLLVLKSLHFPTCAKTQKWRKSLTCAKIACRQQMFFLSDFCQFWYTLTKIVICYLFNFSQIWTPWVHYLNLNHVLKHTCSVRPLNVDSLCNCQPWWFCVCVCVCVC